MRREIFHKECSAGIGKACLELGLKFRNFSEAKKVANILKKQSAGSDLAVFISGKPYFIMISIRRKGFVSRILRSTEFETFIVIFLGAFILVKRKGVVIKKKLLKC